MSALPFGLPGVPASVVQKPAGISLCMIVKNEERFLAQCLQSVAGVVDEIIIVDTGSNDRTIEIARSFGATVVEREWRNDFAWARNESLALATKRWILFLDADEELLAESKAALQQLKSVPAHNHAIFIRCFNQSDDYSGTGAMSHALGRIFPNDPQIRFRGLIHEFPTSNGDPNGLPSVLSTIGIKHHGYLKDVVAARNKSERNMEIVRAAVEAEPEEAFHWFNLGATAFLVGDFGLARDALEKMRAINGEQMRGFVPNALSVLAEVYSDKLNDPVKGAEIARESLRFAPYYANAHFQLGKCLVAQQKYDEARAAFVAAIDDGAHAHVQFVIDDQVYTWKAQCEIGSSYVVEGDEENAIAWFRKGLANAPSVAPLRTNLARALDRRGETAQAEEEFRRAYEGHRDAVTTIDYTNFLLRAGRGVEALAVIDRTHERLPDDAAVGLLLAAAEIVSKRGMPGAFEYLQLAAQRAPGSAEVLRPLEEHHRSRGDAAAIETLRARERETKPRNPADFTRRSYLAMECGSYEEAYELATAGLLIAPNDARLRYNAALSSARLGERERALAHLSAIDSSEREVYAAAELLRASSERERGGLDEAIGAVERLLAVDAENKDALLLRASLYEERGMHDFAERSLRDLLALEPHRGAVELAGYFMRMGRFAEAAKVADEALAS